MAFSLKPLKYQSTSFISEKTLSFHHGKHLQNYINTTNQLIQGSDYENKSLEEIIATSSSALFNNAAQVWNHEFYFNCISDKKVEMSDKLKKIISDNFGSVEEFLEKFAASAVSNFGSGWTWLMQTGPNKLKIMNTSNAQNPMVDGFTPILVIDVWEHAYYLYYQNRRADYVKDFLNNVDWAFVESNLK